MNDIKTRIKNGQIFVHMTLDELKSVLGEPDDWDTGSRKHPKPSVFLYGDIEFGFTRLKQQILCYVMTRDIDGKDHEVLLTDR